MKFYLGTDRVGWLTRTYVPLFISRRNLARRVSLPRAAGPWALDSGGFSELSLTGQWNVTADTYISETRRYKQEIGNLQWAAAMDWMCEPFIIAKTGLSVPEHQKRTVCNYVELVSKAPALPWVPVIQGYTEHEYLTCIDMYGKEGVDLSALPLVGLGSVCRRQGTAEVEGVVRRISSEYGIRLHGFGFKVAGLGRVSDVLASADSMAWSYEGRRRPKPPCCDFPMGNCQKCLYYALRWRREMLAGIGKPDAKET